MPLMSNRLILNVTVLPVATIRAYIHHLFKAKEMLAMRLCVMHNLHFYNTLMQRIRDELDNGTFTEFHDKYVDLLDTRI